MKCPKCKSENLKTNNTIGKDFDTLTFRYKTCEDCGQNFKTREEIEELIQ